MPWNTHVLGGTTNLKTREHLELNLNENVHVTLINSDRPIFDPTAGVARIRFCSEHLF
jgi:hypothetical protein